MLHVLYDIINRLLLHSAFMLSGEYAAKRGDWRQCIK